MATVSDKKLQHSTNNVTVDYFTADVVSANDYYPFGMLMPGRKYSVANTNYRYGFNGKELDKEVSGTITYDYGFRIYSPGLGRFLSVDPLTLKYPYLTPYQFASNSPIAGIDLDGLEFFKKDNFNYRMDYKPVVNAPGVLAKADNAAHNVMSLIWNGTIGALGEATKSVNNYFAGGYKEPAINIVASFDQFQNEAYKYHTKTPIKQQFKDFGNAAMNLENYEALPTLLIAHKLPSLSPSRVISGDIVSARQRIASKWKIHSENVNFSKQVYSEAANVKEVYYQYRIPGTDAGLIL